MTPFRAAFGSRLALIAGLSMVGLAVASAAAVPLPRPNPATPVPEMAAKSALPLPRPNPMRSAVDVIGALIEGTMTATVSPPAAVAPAAPTNAAPLSALISAEKSLKLALDQFEADAVDAGGLLLRTMSDPTNLRLYEWLVATSHKDTIPYARRQQAAALVADWPGQSLIRLRLEQALLREKADGRTMITALGNKEPVSDEAVFELARAYLGVGQAERAAQLIRPFWRDQRFSESLEKDILKTFRTMLTASDHRHRMSRLLYAGQNGAAQRVAALLDKDTQKLATAWSAVNRRSRDAAKTLDAVPASLRKDPGYILARAQFLRRADKEPEAARLLVTAPRDPALLVDPDEWWIERRLLSRAMLDRNEPQLAYRLAAEHSATSPASQADAEFHAGWIALRYLNDPGRARAHFARIREVASLPLSLSRAEYWLARTTEAAGDRQGAVEQYRRAASYATTFYGQLALVWLNQKHLPLTPEPAVGPATRQRFANREIVQAIRRLEAVGLDDRADLFYRTLADDLTDPAEIGLLAAMAEANGDYRMALQIGKNAQARGLPVDTIAFPTSAIPSAQRPDNVDLAVVYALARQESAFHIGAVSSAGARGLMQLMPATAKEAARSAGLPYSRSRLTSDAAYNARLAAAHLDELIRKFDGNYPMIFAAYNAGASRVQQWIEAYGDPRDPKVDAIDWIERIPFTETRNYVQRTMENLQVYRARFGTSELAIEADLKRGNSG